MVHQLYISTQAQPQQPGRPDLQEPVVSEGVCVADVAAIADVPSVFIHHADLPNLRFRCAECRLFRRKKQVLRGLGIEDFRGSNVQIGGPGQGSFS